MSMCKKDFIALADVLRAQRPSKPELESDYDFERGVDAASTATWGAIRDAFADHLASRNPRFNRERWLDYVDGKCGPSGGKL